MQIPNIKALDFIKRVKKKTKREKYFWCFFKYSASQNAMNHLKINKEKQMVLCMIKLFCVKKHKTSVCLCEDCNNLLHYAYQRIEHCPFMETKTFCSSCKVHCYNPSTREKIKEVMTFSGPRMLLYHPFAALSHLIHSKILRR